MLAILKPNMLFPPFLRRKTDWEKTSKMSAVSTLSFKKKSDLGECEWATKHERLFWNINTLTPSLLLNLRPQHSQQTHLHTLNATWRWACMPTFPLLGFTWGSKWATSLRNSVNLAPCMVCRLEHNRTAVMWRCKRYSNMTRFVSTLRNLRHTAEFTDTASKITN